MTTGKSWVTAGLVFFGHKDLDIVKISNRVVNGYDNLDQKVTAVRILSDKCALISTPYNVTRISLIEDVPVASLRVPAEFFLAVQIAQEEHTEGGPARDTMLAHALKTLHQYLLPDYIKWIGANAILSSAEFTLATTENTASDMPMGKRSRSAAERRQSLPTIESTHGLLQQRLIARQSGQDLHHRDMGEARSAFLDTCIDTHQAQNNDSETLDTTPQLRLATWAFSYAVILFSLPVGVFLIIINLVKGENLRLSSQAAALTGTFMSLQVFGTTAQAMSVIQSITG